MIVLVGSPIAEPGVAGVEAGGLAAAIARAAAGSGAAVQVVGRIGDDAAGDGVLLSLAAAGVGHVAILREAGQLTPAAAPGPGESASPDGPELGETLLDDEDAGDGGSGPAAEPPGLSVDAADIELALRYVPDYRVLILAADVDERAAEAVAAAAGWSGAHLIALLPDGAPTSALAEAATVLVRPRSDPDRTFAAMVASYAVALDQGVDPAGAFAAAQRAGGWAAVAD